MDQDDLSEHLPEKTQYSHRPILSWWQYIRRRPFDFYLYIGAPFLMVSIAATQSFSITKIVRLVIIPFVRNESLGTSFIWPLFFPLGFYLIFFIAREIHRYRSGSKNFLHAVHITGSLCFIIVLVCSMMLTWSVTLKVIGVRDQESVRGASERLAHVDVDLFGVYPPLALQEIGIRYPLVDRLLVLTYRLFWPLVFLSALALMFLKPALLRIFFMQFTLAFLVSIPVWYLVPAVSPDELHQQNIFAVPTTRSQKMAAWFEAPVSPRVAAFTQGVAADASWSKPKEGHWAVTTFPSMHVAWGILAAISLALLSKLLLVPALLWVALNIVSTVYTLQHYAVDAIAGIIIAIMSLILTAYIIRANDSVATRLVRIPYFCKQAEEDTRRLTGVFLRTVSRCGWQKKKA